MLEVQMRAHRGETTFSEIRVIVAIIREQDERRLKHIRNDDVPPVRGTQSPSRRETAFEYPSYKGPRKPLSSSQKGISTTDRDGRRHDRCALGRTQRESERGAA